MRRAVIAEPKRELSPRFEARIAGFLYLLVIVGGIFAEVFVRGRLVVHGDATATAQNILAHELLYRFGLAADVFYCACNVPIVFIFYDLFKAVNKRVAVLVVLFSLAGTAIECASLLSHAAPLILLHGGHALSGFTAEQLQAWTYASLQLFEYGFAIALVFFGFYCLAFGYLILKSTFFPRVIGVLLAIEGLLYLTTSFGKFIAPAMAVRVFPFLAASAIGEISLCLWLLVMGVNEQRWMDQTSTVGMHA